MKKLLAIAVAVAFAAPAMADTNVYGKVHMSVAKTQGISGLSVNSHSSRLGFKGSNALDNGLTATHQFEIGYNFVDDFASGAGTGGAVDANAGFGGLSARNSWVGLKGGFGEVRVGRQTTPYSAIDDAVAYPQRNDHALHTFTRTPNALAYINKFGPIGVAAAYVPVGEAEGGAVGNTDSVTNLTVNYKAGPLYAGVGYQGVPVGSDGTKIVLGYNGANYGVGYVHETIPFSASLKSDTISGKYSFGKVSIVGQYGKIKSTPIKQKNIEIGYKLGKGTMAYYEWEDLATVKSNRVGLVHKF